LLWTPRAFVVVISLNWSPKHEKILSPGKGEKYSGLEKETIQKQQQQAQISSWIDREKRKRRSISTSVFKKFIKTFLPQTTARGGGCWEYSQQRILPNPVLHFNSATPHQEHHQHKDKATGAKELTPARKIFIMSLSEK
jgi:hypothetical protein